jgi:hypothetical protein
MNHSEKQANGPGVYILENTVPHKGGGRSAAVIWGKNMKGGREKRGKMEKKKEERGNKKEERGKGKEKEKKGIKSKYEMQNREELRQKGHIRSRKTMCHERGKNIIFRKGGGEFCFWTKI